LWCIISDMRKHLFSLIIIILLTSCVYYGSGIQIVTGTVTGSPANLKIGLFDPAVFFTYDEYTIGAETDEIFMDNLDQETGTYTPVLLIAPTGTTYSLTLPDDPSTVKCLIAWDDTVNDDIFDIGTENGFLPVKTIDNIEYVVTHFNYLEVAEVITYLSVYRKKDPLSIDFDTLYNDNFDAIGADGFNFNF